jgi:hypothetical protein
MAGVTAGHTVENRREMGLRVGAVELLFEPR